MSLGRYNSKITTHALIPSKLQELTASLRNQSKDEDLAKILDMVSIEMQRRIQHQYGRRVEHTEEKQRAIQASLRASYTYLENRC